MPRLKNIYSNLTKVNETEPLSKFVFMLVLMLDVFVFSSITTGVGANIRQLTSESEYVPALCRDIVIDQEMSDAIENRTQYLVLRYHNKTSSSPYDLKKINDRAEYEAMHPICRSYYDVIGRLKDDNNEIIALFEKRQVLERRYNNTKSKINRLSVGNITPENRNDKMTKGINRKYEELNSIYAAIEQVDVEILLDPNVVELRERVERLSIADKKTLKDDLRSFRVWYPVEKLLTKVAFLLPIFLIFYWWFCRSRKKNYVLQKVISAHMLVVVSIPILFESMHIIYSILPKTIFATIIAILSAAKLVALYHYFMIALAIAIAVFLISFFQRKFFSRENIIQKRLAKNSCIHCAKKFPRGSNIKHCYSCGKSQYVICSKCNSETYEGLKYCINCGDNPDKSS